MTKRKFVNDEEREVSRRSWPIRFPSCNFVSFVVDACRRTSSNAALPNHSRDQRHEPARAAECNHRSSRLHANQLQLLRLGGTKGNDHASSILAELRE